MIRGHSVLAVCPARGGSKGIPLKNLAAFRGVPLVGHVGRIVAEIPGIDRAVVSTDSAEIARVAAEFGLPAPFMRPQALSGDRIGDVEVLTHALAETERIDGRRYDLVLMLQPTSPLRTADEVERAITMCIDQTMDAVWTVSQSDSKAHPLKQLVVENGMLDHYDPRGEDVVARQQLSPVFHRNGVAYVIRRDCLVGQHTIKGRRTGALILEGRHVSIDSPWDLELAEYIYARRGRDEDRPHAGA